ncbi:unnamed protein product [Caenorhabditis auriculariae]|uniref:BHLH domain-containing protein n=1 Tax=Caenorhabditis auriculariae TaxID=2777116 RepID=A0A8S1HTK4_9PELO|nr:unnamed protein product [Caenorhabditis auriculariae]
MPRVKVLAKPESSKASTKSDEKEAQPLDLSIPRDEETAEMPLQAVLMAFIEKQLAAALFNESLLLNFLVQPVDCPEPSSSAESVHSSSVEKPRTRRDSNDSESTSFRRNEANARERNRVQQLSEMFDRLRVTLPIPAELRISKLSTLRVASAYIGYLGSLLEDDEERQTASKRKLLCTIDAARALRR